MQEVKSGDPVQLADVFILHGDNPLAVSDRVEEIIQLERGRGLADADITHMDGNTSLIGDLFSHSSMLLLGGSMRLLVVDHAMDVIRSKEDQTRFSSWLENLPPDQVLILILPDSMRFDSKSKTWNWKQVGEGHWLRAVLKTNEKRAAWLDIPLPPEKDMAGWIMQEAERQGVTFEPHAAVVLASQVGNDVFTARHEVRKALDYTNGERAVTDEDVRLLCAADREAGMFDMVDAVGQRDGRTALGLLHRLLDETTAVHVFNMLARQVRLLIMAKEVVETGGSEREIATKCGVQYFVAHKLADQCRRFRMDELEALYRHLDRLDEESKRGFASLEAGMEVLVAKVSNS